MSTRMLVEAEAPSVILRQELNVYVKDWSELILQETGNRTDATMSQDAITKLLAEKANVSDVVTKKSGTAIVYVNDGAGNLSTMPYSVLVRAASIVMRDGSGRIKAATAASDEDVPPLKQVKGLLTESLDIANSLGQSTTKAVSQKIVTDNINRIDGNVTALANKVNDLTGVYRYKGSVTSYENLPKTGMQTGDVYNTEDTGMNYAWNGEIWDALGASFSIETITIDEVDYLFAEPNTTITIAPWSSSSSPSICYIKLNDDVADENNYDYRTTGVNGEVVERVNGVDVTHTLGTGRSYQIRAFVYKFAVSGYVQVRDMRTAALITSFPHTVQGESSYRIDYEYASATSVTEEQPII